MKTGGAEVIEGLVLCRVGPDRLAVRAQEITAFDVPHPQAPYAGAGFTPGALAPAEGKLLRHHAAEFVVDSVEVHADALTLLSVPAVLSAPRPGQAWGGALLGFVEAGGLLWPVFSFPHFASTPEEAS